LKLTIFRKLFNFFKRRKKETQSLNIPDTVLDSEKIVRSIFSPIYLHKKRKTLLPIAFRSPRNIDEVSVNRLDYTTPDFCKTVSKKIENQENRKSYFGLAVLKAEEIHQVDANVVYSPIHQPKNEINLFHSDIKIGYVLKTGDELPAEFQYKVKKMCELARLYPDQNPEAIKWNGGKLV